MNVMKKLISVLLAICLTASLLPMTVLAEESTLVTSQRIGLFDSGVTFEGTGWTTATMADSTGNTTKGASAYCSTSGHYVQYTPENLQPGWYDISFWNIKYQTNQNPMKMTGTVYADGKTITDIELPVNTESQDRGGIWSFVGTYYFDGTNDEYFRLVSTGGAYTRVADVKFELNTTYQSPKVTYQRIPIATATQSGNWATSTMADSTGATTSGISLYGGTAGDYIQYTPENLEPGWYDVSFWNIAYQTHQNPMKMTGTIYANGKTKTNLILPVNTTSADRGGIWSKVGTFYFAGTNDEYFRLVASGGANARPADVKFEKNADYVPSKDTYQHIRTFDTGFSLSGSWTGATVPDSTGSGLSGVSYYSYTVGDYAQYTPENLQPGWYDISFWNIKYEDHQNPMKMTATVYANGKTTTGIELPVNTTSADRGGIWSKVGTFYFNGTNDEYFRLVVTYSGQNGKAADVKFELNEDYVPPKATSQLITLFDAGATMVGANWGTASMPNSTGDTTKGASAYSAAVGHYIQYTPENLEPGWYDVSFWNIKYQTNQNPMKMNATVYANGQTTSGITLPVNTVSEDRGGIWSKIGTYYFAGTDDEYLRLVVATGGEFARPSDVKFELNANYQPPKVTSQRISTFDPGFYSEGNWTTATMPDSTGNTTKGASLYTALAGDYTKYTPSNLEPGWYDVSFWNLKYQDNQNPIKMTGTIYANGRTRENITLPVNTVSEDRAGIWSKVGTYYFAGTNDEYFKLVASGGSYARPSDVKFEKNDNYTPPPALGDAEITISGTDTFVARGSEGVFSIFFNKTGAASDGILTLYVNEVEMDAKYTNYDQTGKEFFGSYTFERDDEIEVRFTPLSKDASSPIDAVYFAPITESAAVYNMYNLQTNQKVSFFTAGMHRIVADVTNKTTDDANYKVIGAVYEDGKLINCVSSDSVTIASGETEQLSLDVPVTNSDNNTTLKVFVWDSFSNMKPKTNVKTFQPKDNRVFGSVTLTPESFDDLGTWKKSGNTSAFTENILLGQTSSTAEVQPATVTFNKSKGNYRIWIRSVNYTDRPTARYFNVKVNDTLLDKTFGQVGEDGLFWEDGGIIELDGETEIQVLDTSKYYAKLDSIVITDDLDYVPADTYEKVLADAPLLNKYTTALTENEMMADFSMTSDYPGGNLVFHKKEKNTVYISPDLSDRTYGNWFYWNFKATSESDRTVTFKISGCEQVIGSSGVVYSLDDGKTWNYLTESAQKTEFTYDMKANQTVQFAVTIPYQYSDLLSYLDTLSGDRVNVSALCKSEENRDVPLVTIGNTNAPQAVILTSRHHCCESTPSYHLEGIMDYLSQDAPDSLFEKYCFYIVPMMDVDGVENGDQGKERAPHDHNRDYQKDRYASVRALKALAADLDVEFFLDLHCPMLQASKPYLYYSTEDKDVVLAFGEVLADATANSAYSNPIIYDGSRDYDSGAHFADCSRGYFFLKVGAPFSTTLEFPYSGVVGDEYTVERIYNFGIDVAKAIETYITK